MQLKKDSRKNPFCEVRGSSELFPHHPFSLSLLKIEVQLVKINHKGAHFIHGDVANFVSSDIFGKKFENMFFLR